MSALAIKCMFLLSVAAGVSAWTIDLPEARKFFFQTTDRYKTDERRDERLFDNIHPDSPHNSDNNVMHEGGYADNYQYMSYMEKKVHGVVHSGSRYLEGLRTALDDYGRLLRACANYNYDTPQSPNRPWLPENQPGQPVSVGNQPGVNGNQFGTPVNQPGSSGTQPGSPGNQPGVNANQSGSFSNQPGSSSNQPGSLGNQTGTIANQTGSFNNQTGSNSLNGTSNGTMTWWRSPLVNRAACERATRGSEHARRLAELALWATRELQDKQYERTYDHEDHDAEEEEAELLVRLAFFLDRLAKLTGYEPEPREYVTPTPTRLPTTTAAPMSAMGEVPEQVMTMMLNCLHANSSEPASERCRYPLPYPEFMKRLFNMTDSPVSVSSSTEPYEPKDPSHMEVLKNPTQPPPLSRVRRHTDNEPEGARDKRGFLMNALFGQRLAHKTLDGVEEELETERFGEHRRRKLLDTLAVLRNSYKKLAEVIVAIRRRHELLEKLERDGEAAGEEGGQFKDKRTVKERRHRRSAEKPMVEFMKFYVKHKVWANANQENPGDLNVANHLSDEKIVTDEYETTTTKPNSIKIRKRSIDNKKYEHMKVPENPKQDISNYVKHKKGVNYITDENQRQKLRQFIEKIQHSKSSTAKLYAQKLLKRQKRSMEYGLYGYGRKYRPSPAQDPRQDISYYVKSAPGRRYRPSAVQAAQVRAGLEQAFQYPDIEVVRRYGANINPLVPYPLGAGIAQTFFGDL